MGTGSPPCWLATCRSSLKRRDFRRRSGKEQNHITVGWLPAGAHQRGGTPGGDQVKDRITSLLAGYLQELIKEAGLQEEIR
jgi:hypothetical protein